jgi:hypothetical protein
MSLNTCRPSYKEHTSLLKRLQIYHSFNIPQLLSLLKLE